ncbi:peptidyl-prolyl cis-trans isomerase FKBP4-like [Oppia nitens]|uniref:peptidyl-prolyl cis-trans isomerase FKBP4-like n=1 Tax=Oppia nitens TaxID=1686743 RepID=UPI0023DBDE7B|nr:peptidyl-prolyl cis-trans isomerase FKBP4-like [Oppia nitens]
MNCDNNLDDNKESAEDSLSIDNFDADNAGGVDTGEVGKVKDISPDRDGKLMKEIIKEGKAWDTPKNGDKVMVHYIGQLLDGTVFDSSRDRNDQFSFTIGANQVIKGWDIAVKTMKRGEVAKFTIAPELAYGETGAGPKIPPNSTLIFEIELFDWKLEDITKKKDSGVCKRILIDGEGYETPNMGATCDISIVGKYDGKVFEQRNVTFSVGEASEEGLVDGLEIAVRKMKKGEKAEVHIRPQYSFGANGRPEFGIPTDYTEVVYEITLNKFEKAKETYQMDNSERLEQANLVKTKGTKYFKESKYKLAIKQYKRIIQLLGPPDDFEGDLKTQTNELLLAGYLNLAMAYIKVENYLDAIKNCDKALDIDADNVKGLFRRGQAYFGQKDYELSRTDFNAVLKLDPNNKAAKNQLTLSVAAIKAQLDKEKTTYRNMFERFAKQDLKKEAKKGDSLENDKNKKNMEPMDADGLQNVDIISGDTATTIA